MFLLYQFRSVEFPSQVKENPPCEVFPKACHKATDLCDLSLDIQGHPKNIYLKPQTSGGMTGCLGYMTIFQRPIHLVCWDLLENIHVICQVGSRPSLLPIDWAKTSKTACLAVSKSEPFEIYHPANFP